MIKSAAVMSSRKNATQLGLGNIAWRVKNEVHVIRIPRTLSGPRCITTAVITRFRGLSAKKLEGSFIL